MNARPGSPDLMGDFLAWAQLSARLLRKPIVERMRILGEAAAERWNETDAHWFDVLVEDVRAGRLDRIDRYAELCAEALKNGTTLPGPSDHLRVVEAPRARPAEPTAAASDPALPAFARKLSPELRPTHAPAAGQVMTQVDLEDMRADALATASALDWELTDYAWLCAELTHAPDREGPIWEARGIRSEAARRAVIDTWRARLGERAELRQAYDDLLGRYLEALRSNTSGSP